MSSGAPRVALADGFAVSRVINGGWQLSEGHGGQPAEVDRTIDALERLVDAGLATFDCGDIYTGVEAMLGRLVRRLAARAGAARRIEIHTKYVPDLADLPGLRRRDVERIVDRSRDRLGVERLDLVQLHWWDFGVPGYVDAAGWLADLRTAGRIRHVGVTNFDVPHLRELLDAGIPVVSNQVQLSLLDDRPARGMIDLCRSRGIHLLCYGALAGGLSERWLGRPPPETPLANRSLIKYRLIIDECGGWDAFQGLLRTLEVVAQRHGTTIATIALRHVLDQPAVAAVIVGARDDRHLAATLGVFDVRLDEPLAPLGGPAGDVYGVERDTRGPHAAIMRYDLQKGTRYFL